MSDPLSIAAGIVGLLTAAAQTSLILKELITQARDASQSCRRVRAEVEDIHNVLGQLQMFLSGGKQATRSRKALIMVDQVAATLASCITTFDELKLFVESVRSDSHMGMLDRARWVYKSRELEGFQVRLEAHKSSLTLMLIILTCQKQDDAEDHVDALCQKVDRIYEMNVMIAQRMLAWDMDQVGIQSDISGAAGSDANDTANTSVNLTSSQPDHGRVGVLPDQVRRNNRGFAFEELLMNSRAYRNAAHNNSEAFSVMSAAGRTATWSMLSGLSLSEMSNIAILAIPIYAHDLNDKENYEFNVPISDANDTHDQSEHNITKQSTSHSPRGWRSIKSAFKRMPASSTQTQSETVTNQQLIFGKPLSESVRYANVAISLRNEQGESFIYGYVPLVTAKCAVFLKESGSDVEDVFARNGHAARMAALQQRFNEPDRFGKGLAWTGYTVHDAAALLLRYLKSLPEPLIPYDHYEAFVKHFRSEHLQNDLSETALKSITEDLQYQLVELPALSRQSLLYILDLLAVFASKSYLNNMTAARLVSCFQPSLLSKRPTEMDADEHAFAARAAIFLVDHQDNFLIGMGTTPLNISKQTHAVVSPSDQPRTDEGTARLGIHRSLSDPHPMSLRSDAATEGPVELEGSYPHQQVAEPLSVRHNLLQESPGSTLAENTILDSKMPISEQAPIINLPIRTATASSSDDWNLWAKAEERLS